ncbi:diguanylate cyclase [Anaeroselena agilis]|uniref:Diguanylate cyclase n=1 Tax=Anaeroselena agilis TaxID=3063788 RepID=A0ABU3P255_9FIRM|nr:diguanylate cyclase [Selenomonadales bacterium 4137-cl]
MHMPLLQIDLWEMTFELLQDLAVMYTVITLVMQKYTAQGLDRRRRTARLDLQAVLFFCLLAACAMLLKVELVPSQGIRFDLRLAVLTLAGVYLGPAKSAVVALFTVVFRLLLGGPGWLWWVAGAFLYGPVAFLTTRFLPAGWGVTAAALANAAIFMGALAILSLFTGAFDYYSPYVSPANFWRLTIIELLMIPLATLILDWALKKSLAFHRSYSDLAWQANFDGMTGLINHRHFQELLTSLLTVPQNQPLSALMIDIDHFKRYNDAFGHQRGDTLLRELAALFMANVRNDDIAARYGGEEFIIILPATDTEAALDIAERMRRAVAAHPFYGREKMTNGRVSVSIGVATYPVDAAGKNALISAADKALYTAKRAGRNQVKKYTPDMEDAS